MNTHAKYQYTDTIRLAYGSLAEGLSVSGELCPACEGGRTGERSLSVSRVNHSLLFICHRAACALRGGVTVLGNGDVHEGLAAGRPVRLSGAERYRLTGKGPLPKGVSAYLETRYHLRQEDFARGELSWTREYSGNNSGRLVMPVRDVASTMYGFVARRLDSDGGPKTLSFLEDTRGAWYHKAGSNGVLLVEDQLSAIRAAHHITTVALLGAVVSDSLLSALVKRGYDRVYLALDKDAYDKSIKQALRFRDKIRMRVPQLPCDIKDMPPAQVLEWLDKEEISK